MIVRSIEIHDLGSDREAGEPIPDGSVKYEASAANLSEAIAAAAALITTPLETEQQAAITRAVQTSSKELSDEPHWARIVLAIVEDE